MARNLHHYFGRQINTKPPPEIIVIDSDDSDEEQSRVVNNQDISFCEPDGLHKSQIASTSTAGAPLHFSRHPDLSGDDDSEQDVVNSLPVNGDWEMSDDELQSRELDDFAPQLSDETTSTVFDKVDICPVCGKSFIQAFVSQLQEHVNECLDRSLTQSSKQSTRPSVTPMPLRPLSSLSSMANANRHNAFSVLMSSHKENEAWREAEIAEKSSTFKIKKGRRKAPFYKVLQGMPIAVDAFLYRKIPGVTAYFLTHAHSDHYTNLSSSWNSGPIYCSQGTANLILHMLSVDPKWVHPLPMDVSTVVPNTGGVQVTLIEANHCPGSCIFFFEGVQTINAGDSTFQSSFVGSSRIFRYLHCGDFRAAPRHVLHPAVKGKKIDHVYLDTTYLDPKYCFPPQSEVISACADLARKIVLRSDPEPLDNSESKEQTMNDMWGKVDNLDGRNKPETKVLIVVGTYSVGKERVVSAVAKSINTKIYCDERKASIIRCQSDPDLESMLTDDPLSAGVHIIPLGFLTPDKLKTYSDKWKDSFNKVVGFRPTGWTFIPPAGMDSNPTISTVISRAQQRTFSCSQLALMKGSSQNLQVYAVPYSEHSSFFELTCFALSLEWGKMIPTVNVGSEKSRAKMGKWFDRWKTERKKQDIVEYRNIDYW